MKFKNKPSECLDLANGEKIWKSRSVAVVGHVFCKVPDEELSILMVKRGRGSADNIGKWCLPCGYLDWNETGHDAITREIWEETGVNVIQAAKDAIKVNYNGIKDVNPWKVNTDPDDDVLQNISLHYGVTLKSEKYPEFEKKSGGEENEVDEIRWVPIEEVKDLDIAFNHGHRIFQFIDFLMNG